VPDVTQGIASPDLQVDGYARPPFAFGGRGASPRVAHADVVATSTAQILAMVKAGGDQSWLVPGLNNSWVPYGAPYANPGYRRDALGFVHLQGLVKNGTAGLIFTLPTGYRPLATKHFAVVSSNGTTDAFGSVLIDATGNVTANAYNSAYVSLSGITFLCEQ
jgi:hypothetical protein